MLEEPRTQLERVASRLARTAGMGDFALASEVVAFSYVAAGAAVEAALKEAVGAVLEHLQLAHPWDLDAFQTATLREASFQSFVDAERVRGRHDPKKALGIRKKLVAELSGSSSGRVQAPVLQTTGVPKPEHFEMFFQVATGGGDPRGLGATPPLPQLVGRVRSVSGPRNDFAHECAEPTEHPFVVGASGDAAGLASRVAALQSTVDELLLLLDVLELACDELPKRLRPKVPSLAGLMFSRESRLFF